MVPLQDVGVALKVLKTTITDARHCREAPIGRVGALALATSDYAYSLHQSGYESRPAVSLAELLQGVKTHDGLDPSLVRQIGEATDNNLTFRGLFPDGHRPFWKFSPYPPTIVAQAKKGVPDTPSIGPYRLGKKIGMSAIAEIFSGVHLESGARVVIKVFWDVVQKRSFLRELFNELRFQSSPLAIKQTVAVYEAGITAGARPYLVMEYMAGGHIYDEGGDMKRNFNSLTEDGKILFCRKIVSAVAETHRRGIIHRDIKGGNLLLDRNDLKNAKVKLADFGFAQFVKEAQEGHVSRVYGTWSYIPSYVVQTGIDNPNRDVYAIGVTLHLLLTGSHPYFTEFETDTGAIQRMRRSEKLGYIRPSTTLPPALERVVMRAIELDPKVTYQDAVAMLKDMPGSKPNFSFRR